MASSDRLGLEAIKTLHSQLDDDANGAVDLSESDDVSYFSQPLKKNILIKLDCIYSFYGKN